METKLLTQQLGALTALYAIRDDVMSFTLVPSNRLSEVKECALYKNDWSQYWYADPMVQIALKGDETRRDFSAGNTTYDSETSYSLKFVDQVVKEDDKRIEIHTTFENSVVKVVNVVAQVKGFEAIEMYNSVKNISKGEIALDRISTFFLGNLSPFMTKNNPEKLILHELQSYWALEARKESTPLSKFNFDDSWSAYGIKHHKIGVNGTMPANGYHPFVAIEDIENHATWAIQLESPSSWQIETIHKYGRVSLSGGIADYLNGHWRKSLQSGEEFVTRKAYMTVVSGDLTLACSKLTRYHDNLLTYPESEKELPVMFNEYLTTWGNPRMDNIPAQLPLIKKLECEYYVVDSGWFCDRDQDTEGDWVVSKLKFPKGLKEYTDYMYSNGFSHAGIWFEFENATDNSNLFKNHPEVLATKEGKIIHRESRMFLDFNKQVALDYLEEKVVKLIRENNISYIKIDYNENVGLGIDNKDSLGEGLRLHTEKVIEFMKHIRKEFPNLILENCSSGGMRHEITFNTVTSMSSFSDAHENPEGAVVAMDLHRIMQPRIMQIWASLLPKHTIDDIYIITAKAMLGRICFAGQLDKISPQAIDVALEGKHFYDKIKYILRDGNTTLIDTDEVSNLSKPHGSTRLVRESADKTQKVCYAFNYGADVKKAKFDVKGYKLIGCYGNAKINGRGKVQYKGERSAVVALFEKN